ncbi:MAG: hypothetical protein AAGF10_06145 [Verrucomicrobiota bacterium]
MTPEGKKRFYRTVAILVLFFVVFGIAAVPSWKAFKETRAREQVGDARQLLVTESYEEALEKARAANNNDPENPDTSRVIAEIYDAVDAPEAAQAWASTFALSDDDADLRQWASAALKQGDLETVGQLISVMEERGLRDSTYHYLRGQLFLRERDLPAALEAARLATAGKFADPRAHLFYVQMTQFFDDPVIRLEGMTYLREIARREDDIGLQALRSLANYEKNTEAQREDVIRLLRLHPFAERQDQLLALKLEYALPGSNAAANLAEAKRYFSAGNLGELTELGRWLNQQGRFTETMQAVPMQKAMRRRDLLLVRLDALAQLGRWDEVAVALNQPNIPLEDVEEQFLRSRVQFETGQIQEAQISWERALLAARGDAAQLWYLVDYATQLDLDEEAIKALWQLTEIASEERKAYDALLSRYQQLRQTENLVSLLQRMAEAYPQDIRVLNDWAYINLLLDRQVPLALGTARSIIEQGTPYLANRITLALGLYRSGQLSEALAVLEPLELDWGEVPDQWRGIYAVILRANGRSEDAQAMAENLRTENLLPEERALIQKVWQ